MRQSGKVEPQQAWVIDYSVARTKAIQWLGDRYLLATPINRKPDTRPTRVGLKTPT